MMKATKLFAVGLIASAMSVSAFAAKHESAKSDVQIRAYLNDLIRLQVSPVVNLTYRDGDGTVGDLIGSANMVVKMRYADRNTRQFDLIVGQKKPAGGEYTLRSMDSKHKMPFSVSYYDEEVGAPGSYQTPNKPETYETTNGLNGNKETSLFFVVNPEDHSLAPAGRYVANLTVTVAAK